MLIACDTWVLTMPNSLEKRTPDGSATYYAMNQLFGSRCQISPSPKLNQRVVVTFCCVKKCTPSLPCMCRSPKNDSFHPLNGNHAIEAGTPILIPTIPHWIRCLNSRAALPERVKIDAPFP